MRASASLLLCATLAVALAGCGHPGGDRRSIPPVPTAAEIARAERDRHTRALRLASDRPDWGEAFAARGAVGTMLLFDTATERLQVHNAERAATRFTPASTSKVFNGLVFLDQGVLADPDSMLAWDGTERRLDVWNQDHSLRTGTRASAVWLFQRLANAVGRQGYADVFARFPYGNATMGTPLDMAWLDGTLQISAQEQLAFIDGLHRETLPFAPEHQATIRDVLPVLLDGDGWTLRAKTGWGQCCGRPDIGWLVGWLERARGDVVFVMNAEAAPGERFDIGEGRLGIVRDVLDGEGLLPDEG